MGFRLLASVGSRGTIPETLRSRLRGWSVRLGILVGALTSFAFVGFTINAELAWHTTKHSVTFTTGPDLTIRSLDERARQAGFEDGDRLVLVDTQDVASILDYRRAIQQQPIGTQAEITVVRGTETRTFPVMVTARRPDAQSVGYYLVALCFLSSAALVGVLKPGQRSTMLFFVTGISIGLYFATLRKGPLWLHYAQVVFLTLSPGLAIHFFAGFLREKRLAHSRFWPVFHLPGLVLMAGTLGALFRSVQAGTGIWYDDTYALLANVSFIYLALSGVLGLGVVAHAYARTPPSRSKRELQWVLWGLACASTAAILDTTLTYTNLQTQEISVLTLALVLPLPLGFTFAILRYRLLDVDFVVSRSVVYGILTTGIVALYILSVGSASSWLVQLAGGSHYGLLLFLSALVAGILFAPLRSRLQAAVDRHFFRRQVDFQRATIQWSQELSTSIRFASLHDLLVNRIPQELMIDRAWLLVLSNDGQVLRPLRGSAQVRDSMTGDSTHDATLAVSAARAIATGLAQPSRVWLLPPSTTDRLEANEGDSLHFREPGVEEIWEPWTRAGARVVLPLMSGERLVGLYLLGHKLSNDIYLRQELDLLRTLANQAAIAVSNARLYETVQATSLELEDKVQERTQALRDFVSVVYHELGTPLTAIQGYTELLLEGMAGELAERQIRFLETVHRNSQRLRRLVDDLSDLSEIDDGRVTLAPRAINLAGAAQEALSALGPTIEEKQLQIGLAADLGEVSVRADPGRLLQILTNLLSNACHFTDTGGHITLSCSTGNGSAAITVRDTGIGIRPEEMERLFKRFYRGDDARVRAQPGWGLGLAISRSLVHLHGGQLWVESEPGKGSTFTFTLPLADMTDSDREA